jgi:hypothetical protein
MFSRRNRPAGRHARDTRSRREPEHGQWSLAGERPAPVLDRPPAPDPPAATERPAGAARIGPYDIAEAPPGDRMDLGSLKIPTVPGVEIRMQTNQDGVVHQVYLVCGESALQLGAFAAPRSEPIWDEVRAEIRRSLFDDGVAAEEVAGDYGTELRARVRTPQGLKDLRFVGVDGPRWLARAVYQGPAAVDPASARPLVECLRGVVVDRGGDAMPAKEPLPLKLSDALAEQVRAGVGGAPAHAQAGAPAGAIAPTGAPARGAGGDPPTHRRPSPRPRPQE